MRTTIITRRNRIAVIAFGLLFPALSTWAQRDTSKPQTIDITSSFKPSLRKAAKINFSGTALAVDTTRPVLAYTIPEQNLFYAYRPVTLQPLALRQDSNLYLGNRRYVKAGFGSYTTPYVQAGFSFGDGRTSLVNVAGDYVGSKGNEIAYEDFNEMHVKVAGSYFLPKQELYGYVANRSANYYLYGYDHTLYPSVKQTDIRQQYQDIALQGGFRNTATNPVGINYDPHVEAQFFTNRNLASETDVQVYLPIEKRFAEQFSFRIEGKADLTNYATKSYIPANITLSNNIVQVSPTVSYHSPLLNFTGGISPVWNNGKQEWLPNIHAEAQLEGKRFMLQGGWTGKFVKNSYRNLSQVNPYMAIMTSQLNTKETEFYGGIKATVGGHFNMSATAGWIKYENFALFVNDTAALENKFDVVYEPTSSNLRIKGDISYVNQDKFSLTAGLTLNGYTGFRVNDHAYHTLPMEFTTSLRWWAMKKLLVKADAYTFAGPKYITKGKQVRSLDGATDLSLGAEYSINKQFSLWLDGNNLLNNKYQRWHNYEVYGLNLVGGIRINF